MQDSTPTPVQSQTLHINKNYLENSNFKTKKKPFISDVDPHFIKRKIQQERYIWFGVYNELLRNKNIIKLLKNCKDTSIPIESASIHLEKYKIGFNKNRIFISYSEDSVIFFKLYLITKEQFISILNTYYLCNNNIYSISKSLFQNSLTSPQSEFDLTQFQLNKNAFYNIVKCVGELDNILIYAVTTKQTEIIAPEPEYLKSIYNGLRKSFQPYSEFLLMYYVYLLDGVRNYYTIKQLQEVFLNNKSLNDNSSAASSETNMTIETGNNQNKYLMLPQNTLDNLNSTPGPRFKKDNETVKCSTCNASPFMATPEKDQLNQYSYIFDLHHLPIFDANTGEFFWSNNEANWKIAKDSIIRNEEANGKSMSMNHGSVVSLSNSFCGNGSESKKDNGSEYRNGEQQKWIGFKNENNNNTNSNHSGTFIEELNNILKEIN